MFDKRSLCRFDLGSGSPISWIQASRVRWRETGLAVVFGGSFVGGCGAGGALGFLPEVDRLYLFPGFGFVVCRSAPSPGAM